MNMKQKWFLTYIWPIPRNSTDTQDYNLKTIIFYFSQSLKSELQISTRFFTEKKGWHLSFNVCSTRACCLSHTGLNILYTHADNAVNYPLSCCADKTVQSYSCDTIIYHLNQTFCFLLKKNGCNGIMTHTKNKGQQNRERQSLAVKSDWLSGTSVWLWLTECHGFMCNSAHMCFLVHCLCVDQGLVCCVYVV